MDNATLVNKSAENSLANESAVNSIVNESAKSSLVNDAAKSSFVRESAKLSLVNESAVNSIVNESAKSSLVNESTKSSLVNESTKPSLVNESAVKSFVNESSVNGFVIESAKENGSVEVLKSGVDVTPPSNSSSLIALLNSSEGRTISSFASGDNQTFTMAPVPTQQQGMKMKKLFPGNCSSVEEPCRFFSPYKSYMGCTNTEGGYYCRCNLNGEPMAEDSKCEKAPLLDPGHFRPNKIYLNLTNRNDGQNSSVQASTPGRMVDGESFNSSAEIGPNVMDPTKIIVREAEPPDDSSVLLMATSHTFQVATMFLCLFLFLSFLICCCRRRKSFPFFCLSRHSKAKKKARNMRNIVGMNMVPISFNKEFMDEDRYTSNPLYVSSSMSSSEMPVPILSRDDVAFDTEIGEGCFGKVFKGELKANGLTEVVAIKVLKDNASREAEDDFMREVEIMSSFRQANILFLLGVVPKEPGKKPWMVFEYMPYGDLAEVLRGNSGHFQVQNPDIPRLSKEHLLLVSQQIAAGMKYLADQRFVHRDLACRNCLVGNNLTVKIADFGMSRDVYTCDYYKIGGSRLLPVRWMSPESVVYGRFTPESDVWSYGVVLWEIYSLGKQPYFGHCNEEVLKLILQGIMLIPPDNCPRAIMEVMSLCWKTEPRDRIKFPEICERLSKPMEEEAPLPRPPALPIATDHLSTLHRHDSQYNSNEMLDEEQQYLQPGGEGYSMEPPGRFRQYFQPLPS